MFGTNAPFLQYLFFFYYHHYVILYIIYESGVKPELVKQELDFNR